MTGLKGLAEASRALDDYFASAKFFAKKEAYLIKKHPDQWVAIYKCNVRAVADTLDALIAKIEKQNIPKKQTIARKLELHRRTLIL